MSNTLLIFFCNLCIFVVMKIKNGSIVKLFAAMAVACLSTKSIAEDLKIADFNMDFSHASDPGNIAEIRKPKVDEPRTPFDFSLRNDSLKCFVSDGCQVTKGGARLRFGKDFFEIQLKF